MSDQWDEGTFYNTSLAIGELFIAYYMGRRVPTTFTGYLAIPTRTQFEAFVDQLRTVYDDYTDEEIAQINRSAEMKWHKESEEYDRHIHDEADKRNRKTTPGYVYLIRAESGHYKIGHTGNPESRWKTFGVQLPFQIEFICLIKSENMRGLESELHKRFSDKRVNGEWFNLTPADVEYIKGLAS